MCVVACSVPQALRVLPPLLTAAGQARRPGFARHADRRGGSRDSLSEPAAPVPLSSPACWNRRRSRTRAVTAVATARPAWAGTWRRFVGSQARQCPRPLRGGVQGEGGDAEKASRGLRPASARQGRPGVSGCFADSGSI